MKYSQVKARQPAHILITGEPKTGKTLLVTTLAAKGFKILFFSLDNGLMTVFDKVPKDLLESNFEFVSLPDTTDFPVAYQTLYTVLQGKPTHICDQHGQVQCTVCKKDLSKTWTDVCLSDLGLDWVIVMDHATQLTKSAMNYYLKKQSKDPEEYKFEWEDWRKLGVMMDRIFLPIQQSRNNWIVLAHVSEVEMEDGKKKLTAAIGTGNYARNSGGFFDHVVYCEVANMKHNIGSSTTFRVSAITGSRSDIAIEKMLDKDGRATLVPFFDGTIPGENKHYASAAAKSILIGKSIPETKANIIEENINGTTVSLPGNGNSGNVSNDVVSAIQVAAVVPPAGATSEVAAGVVTRMHSPAVAISAADLQKQKATELLAKFRNGAK